MIPLQPTQPEPRNLTESEALTVTDLKQWGYCGRVVYYERCLPQIRPTTYKMQHGVAKHRDQPRHALRRTLTTAGITDGERYFNVRYYSPRLGLTGMLDEVIVASDGQIIPVDYKTTPRVADNHRLQLAAYALLIGEVEQVSIPVGYIYLVPRQKMVRVALDAALIDHVRKLLEMIHTMIQTETMPAPPENRNRCLGCEFWRFCNDV